MEGWQTNGYHYCCFLKKEALNPLIPIVRKRTFPLSADKRAYLHGF